MTYIKTIVCLANSRKHSGRCIAGKEVLSTGYGCWIRPVSKRSTAEVSEMERQFENGQEPLVLDIINIPITAAAPADYQAENHIIDGTRRWSKVGRLSWTDLVSVADHPEILWSNGNSTHNGVNDRVSLSVASTMTYSLVLIKPESLTVVVQMEGAEFDQPKRRVRADFIYREVNYKLSVTDLEVERAFLAKPDGDYRMVDAYVCVSLGEPYHGCCYKLVAAVICNRP